MARNSFVWSACQYGASRSTVAIGWIIVAQNLNAAEFGHFSTVVLVMTILDSLSMPGLNQAFLQSRSYNNTDLANLWSAQAIRGILLAIFTASIVYFVYPETFNFIGQQGLIVVFSYILVKNLQSLWSLKLQKNNDFRGFFVFEFLSSIVEVLILLTLISSSIDPILAYFVSLLAGAFVRLFVSWTAWPHRLISIHISDNFVEMMRFGKWLWLSSILIVIANFTDKIFASFMSAEDLGKYTLTARFSQLIFADWAAAYAAYLFPRLSAMNQKGHTSFNPFNKIMAIGVIISLSIIMFIALFPRDIMQLIFGEAGANSDLLLCLQAASMMIGAVIAQVGAALKAQGNSKTIFRATLYQVFVLYITIIPLHWKFGIHGLVISNIISLSTTLYLISKGINKNGKKLTRC